MDQWNSVMLWVSANLGPYAARVFGVLAIVLAAWLVARALRALLLKVCTAKQLDERMRSPGIGAQLADVVYWLVWLLALPVLLELLQLQGLLLPVQAMLASLLGFLPKLVGAAVVLGIGFIAARIVRQIVTGALKAAGSERIAQRLGLSSAVGEDGLAGLVGNALFVLMLLPVVAGALQPLELDALTRPVSAMLDTVMALIPKLLAAAIVLVAAALLGRALSQIVSAVLSGAGFNALPARLGLAGSGTIGGRTAAELVGTLLFGALLLVALIQACEILGFRVLTEAMAGLGGVLAQVLLGALVMLVGLWIATAAGQAVHASASANAAVLAMLTRAAILFFSAALALRQAGLPAEIVAIAFGAVMAAAAIGVGVAVGVGGRHVAGRLLERAVASFGKRSDTQPPGQP